MDRNNRHSRRGDPVKGGIVAETRRMCQGQCMLTDTGGSECSRGFTVIEVLIAFSIIAILSAIAIPSYTNYLYKARVARAITEIRVMERDIWSYQVDTDSPTFELKNEDLPDDLDAISQGNLLDPWGTPYNYTKFLKGQVGLDEKMRKCRFFKPLNTDYDLFSNGKDKVYKQGITAPESLDDIIRANNGSFVGLASEF